MEATIDQPGDLWGQVESLLDAVWECERQWRLDDRFDLLLGRARRRARA